MKKVLILIILLGWELSMFSIPAHKKISKIKQSDGTFLNIILCGDEYSHFFMTTDSVPVFETLHGFCYGSLSNDTIAISDDLAHNHSERTDKEKKYVENKNTIKNFLFNKHQEKLYNENSRRFNVLKHSRSLGVPKSFVGAKKGLVILANFANLSMSSIDAHNEFNELFNKEGYSKNGSVGSVHDYFYDQSYGKFDLTFDVIGPVTISHNYSYYGANSEISGSDKRPYEMIIEVCQLVDDKVDFKDYDWDGDGEVDQVFVIYAGYGEHAGVPSNTIWPHESCLGSRSITLDGVRINTYACSSELNGNFGQVMSGIGTPCHEFSHCLGLPDLYDTDYSGAFGMSYWDLMNSGSYSGPNADGEVPYGYSAYERWFAGWLEMKEISSSQHIETLPNLEETPEAYIIYNEGSPNEYYILENHQPSKWFKYVRNYTDIHGLMVTHVDYDQRAWTNNVVNPNTKHQRMSIIPADNSYGETEQELRGDLFPGSNKIQWLTNDSHINVGGQLFNVNTDGSYRMNRVVGNVLENSDGSISMDVVFSEDVPAPVVKDVTEIDNNGYTLNWEAVPNAEYYIVEQTSYKIASNLIPTIKKQTVDNVLETSLRLEWLTDGATKVRVKSVVNGFESDWSELVEVPKLSNGINIIMSGINSSQEYYSLDGIRLKQPRKGLVLMKKDGKVKKYFVAQ